MKKEAMGTTEQEPLKLDDTPTGKEEEKELFSREHLETLSFEQDIKERKKFADRAYTITKIWVGFLVLLTGLQFFLKKAQFVLSEIEFNVVFSTTTASVLAFWYLVGKYLFNTRDKSE